MALQPTLDQLSHYLLQTLSPDANVRKEAEKIIINQWESSPRYCQLLLQMISTPAVDATIKLAAAIAFKNFVKKHWRVADDSLGECGKISFEDRNHTKTVIIELMLNSDEKVQRQLSEAVSIIGKEDFPAKWPNLLESMIAKLDDSCRTYNFNVINGILQTANSLFKRYQYELKSESLWKEIKFVLDTFCKPFTTLFVWIVKLIPEHVENVANIKIIFQSLCYCAEIYLSLNSQDLPEFFEDSLEVWMGQFNQLLQCKISSLETDSTEEPGLLEQLKSQISEILAMFAEKYSEEFGPYLPQFINQIWILLDSLDGQVKYDLLVSNAMRFLSIVANHGLHKEMFDEGQALQQICSRVIIPNMEFRESDAELFEDDPEEYIRHDFEGADVQTRRRAACDLVKALAKHFEKPITNGFSLYIRLMLDRYAQNPKENWKSKNAAIYLVTSLVVKGGSVRLGTTSTSDLINIVNFFNTVIRADLEAEDVNDLPVLKADALKYLTIFRNQLPADEILVPLLPHIVRHLASPIIVVHSYAAICIEKLLTIRDPSQNNRPLIKAEQIQGCAKNILEGLLAVLELPGSLENEYAMKALMRLFSLLQESALPYFYLISKLAQKLSMVAKNPSKPNFNHYLFETFSICIRIACNNRKEMVHDFEAILFPIFETILTQDVQEFLPYVFQILALMLENYPPANSANATAMPKPYMELFPFLLMPVLWELSGSFIPLTRLMQAYIKNCCPEIIAAGKLEPVLGIFQKLIASKMNDHLGFKVLNHLLVYADSQALMPLMNQIFFLLFQRLTVAKTTKYVRLLLIFFSLYAHRYGSQSLFDMIESLRAKMFQMVLTKLFIADARKVSGPLDRKTLCIGMTRIITDLDQFFTDTEMNGLWVPMLETIIAVIELPQDNSPTQDEQHFVEIEDVCAVSGYQAAFSRLIFATNPEPDLIEEIKDPVMFLAQRIYQLSERHPGKLTTLISTMSPEAMKFFQGYLLKANIANLK